MLINGQTWVHFVNFEKTFYPSPYMVMTEKEYTKHYFIERERVCSKLGSGFGVAPISPTSTPLSSLNGATDEEISDGLWDLVERNAECVTFNPEYIFIEDKLGSAENEDAGSESDLYFYHSDHLGSSAFITDAAGNAYQHLQYLPFGESFIDQRHSGYNVRYTFSAKEKDEETSYSYFGARYYDSELSVWLSVDPMGGNFPSISPYNYCLNVNVRGTASFAWEAG